MNDVVVWSLIGIILLMIECFLMQGMGILFTGFASISVSAVIYFKSETLMGAIGTQLGYFIMFTFFWSTLLWMPLRHFYGYSAEDMYKNVVGSFAIVHHNFNRNEIGMVNWSGKIVKAKIDPTSKSDDLKAKSHVKVTAIEEGIYIIKPVREDIEGFKDRATILREQEQRKAEQLAAAMEAAEQQAFNPAAGITAPYNP